MKINRNENETCPFGVLGEGEVFENEENQQICIKVRRLKVGDDEDDIINAIDVVDGSSVFFYDDEYVIRLDAELKIN
jgi:hypothetical protein